MNHSEISSFIWGTADLLRSSFKQHEYGEIVREEEHSQFAAKNTNIIAPAI